ncbi:MAG: glucose-6-phosphate 1-dehydrogenase [Moorella sp. (in: firmicutes)]|uniref:glucose-6-phosphate dehydrogenase n=1 Tax=unclassified Neomoorella TaxID=2676739 RepID=UPI0010FFC0D9|nr:MULTISPECIES: glucose-6-phosphate dehydrogenase [unclassified Moorella (in: firmicutes)]MDK2816372.1 glucose-6-phosphate 1-dehydrogenase [Moorella sp. (in: firmicutes)]MDK2894239.1 glucose-6-phosphate 1-dehydrogenase [Moorella sp. (in: firmicutes)]GEA14206.1 glucose-6-phosphate 1-dehydrogenase [Moorella sp. E308F]GEA18410.1 glucose-6-phosphate 1-dehydrogenase [Moorella sp. E306M]
MGLEKPDNSLLVIFGGTGDLARRKLYPALYNLFVDGFLPAALQIVAVGRRLFTPESFRNGILLPSLQAFSRRASNLDAYFEPFASRLHYFPTDIYDPEGYKRLRQFLAELEEAAGCRGNRIFYLAVAPEHFGPVVRSLKEAGLAPARGWQRVVIEKPFGHDLPSAAELNRQLRAAFSEEEIYRIDHYLGKEMIQNIMVIRFANTFFEPVWNNKYIDHVQITSAETVGVEDRGGYYDKAGALRDMVQNHLLQLVTLVAMEPPASLATEAIRDEKVKVLRSLRPLDAAAVSRNVIRGQYGAGEIDGQTVPPYRREKEVAPDSTTETFVALKLFIENFRWAGVPFYLRTGKRLPVKVTEIILQFKSLPDILYFKEYGELRPNLLVIRVQPLEGVYVQLNAKRPGNNNYIVPIRLDFCQNCEVGVNSPEAYERLLYDVMRGDPTLFTRWDEVEAAWRFVDPIAATWTARPPLFPNYAAGQWGPPAAQELLIRDGRHWWQEDELLPERG